MGSDGDPLEAGNKVLGDVERGPVDVDGKGASLIVRLLQANQSVLIQSSQVLFNSLGIFLETRAKDFLVDLELELLFDQGLRKTLTDNQLFASLVRVNSQIVGRAIGTANALLPAVRGVNLGIPAVAGVMGHLVGHVLTETNAVGVDTDLGQEHVDADQEVAQSLVVDNLLLHSLANSDVQKVSLARELDRGRQDVELVVGDLAEARVVLLGGVDIVLNLGHGELSIKQKK